MTDYDLVIRNTTIATASDVVKGDIGIVRGRVVALGEKLDKGRREIDATGLIAVPGGIDAHALHRERGSERAGRVQADDHRQPRLRGQEKHHFLREPRHLRPRREVRRPGWYR